MPSVTRIQYALPNGQYLDHLLTDDLILRYVKDDYEYSENCWEFYDTADWLLTRKGFSLNVSRDQELHTVQLARGRVSSPEELPGLFHGDHWVAPYTGIDYAVDALMERGAPEAFRELTVGQHLQRNFFILYKRKSTTLYLPERTRIDMAFDSGEIVAGEKRQPTYDLSMELLYGEEKQLVNYCQQICERFDLPPVLLSREQRALKLLRGE